MRQDAETLFLRPEIGWAVLDASAAAAGAGHNES
jgi:hypothetical protein